MAFIKIVLIELILFCIVVDHLDARRGGGGRGGWGRGSSSSRRGGWGQSSSSSMTSYSGRTSYSSRPLSGRIITGSSPYSGSTWRYAAMSGHIYGYNLYVIRFPRYRDSSDLPPICTDYKTRSPEGRVYGYFLCPRTNESSDETYCCGPERAEYCCNRTQAEAETEAYFSQRRERALSKGSIIAIVVGVLCVVAVVAFICKRQAWKVLKTFSTRGGKRSGARHADPLIAPVESHKESQHAPTVPPPPYSAATSQVGYDGDVGLPYSAQPYLGDGKSGLPPPGIDAQPPYPYQAPYPPPQSGYPNPPAVGAPYPQATNAPYPPSDNMPYAPMVGTTYQPPLQGDAPYPTSGAPYLPPDASAPPYSENPSSPALAVSPAYDSSAPYLAYPPHGRSQN